MKSLSVRSLRRAVRYEYHAQGGISGYIHTKKGWIGYVS